MHLEDDEKRSFALEMAVEAVGGTVHSIDPESILRLARPFYEFLSGDSDPSSEAHEPVEPEDATIIRGRLTDENGHPVSEAA